MSWTQWDDLHWFGGRIADAPMAVEFVQARDAGRLPVYRQYNVPDLHEHSVPLEIAGKQIGFLTTLGTSVVAIAASLIVPQ